MHLIYLLFFLIHLSDVNKWVTVGALPLETTLFN